MAMTETRRQVILRMDDELYEALASWAQEEDRSVNQHVVRLLRLALVTAGRWPQQRPPQ